MATLTKAERTRNRIIEAAAPVFNRKGYAGTALSDIINATGLTKGGIYGNFSGKDEIAMEVFEYNKDRLFEQIHQQVKAVESPLQQLHTFFQVHGEVIQTFPEGCPILNTAVESDDTHPELKKRARAAVLIWINYLKGIIRQGIQAGEFRPVSSPDRYARTFISMVQGAVFMGRLTGNQEAYEDVIHQIRRVIDLELVNYNGLNGKIYN